MSCCPHPQRVDAPVDGVLHDHGLRFRRLPGAVCLTCRDVSVPAVDASAGLERAIRRCLSGDPSGLTILKADASPSAQTSSPLDEGSPPAPGDGSEGDGSDGARPARLDVALGPNAGLVVENLPGAWIPETRTAILPDRGHALRRRLARLSGPGNGTLVPSFAYETPSHPRSVQFEVTTRCNLRCGYCTHRHLPTKADASTESWRSILDRVDVAHLDNVDFTGLGEPVLHPELPDMVAEIHARGTPTDVRVVTNGTALSPSRFRPLCEAGITSIAFSIDSLDPDRFARSRGGARLAKVLRNLEALVDYRKTAGLHDVRIKIKAVLIDDPYEEAEQLLAYSARLGLEMPHFSCLDPREAVQDHYQEAEWLEDEWSEEQGAELLAWAGRRWTELTGTTDAATNDARDGRPPHALRFSHPMLAPPPSLCRWAVDAAYVSLNGDMLSCCEQMMDLPRRPWSSIHDGGLAETWMGDLFWSYRLPLALGHVPRGCAGCTWAPDGRAVTCQTAAAS